MALRIVRIGALEDAFQYDDGEFPTAIETNQPIEAGAPTDPVHVIRQGDLPTLTDLVYAEANIVDDAIVRGDGGASRKVHGSNATVEDDGSIDIPTAAAYKVNSIQVVTDQQAVEADIAVVPDLTGGDTIDQSDLESYLGDIRTTVNNLLAKLRTHGLIDT